MDTSRFSIPEEIHIRDKSIGRNHPAFIIAEIGNNHNGDLDLALRTIDAAARAGADAVKFQRRTVDEVFTKELLETPQTHSKILGKTYREYRLAQELTDDELAQCRDHSHELGMSFFVTPFDLTSARALAAIGMDAWKIASFDVNHRPLLEFVAGQNQPIFMSTGMATTEDIDAALETILPLNTQIVVKHCVSIYPTPDEDLNLGAIKTLKERYAPIPIGFSGHELGFFPTVAAVALGAHSVERHFTLSKTLPGPDHLTVSLDPVEFADMVRQIRKIERAIKDDGVYLHDREVSTRNKHGKSVATRVAIPANTKITEDMLCIKSPGYGIKPTLMHTVVGRVTKIAIPEDSIIIEDHLA